MPGAPRTIDAGIDGPAQTQTFVLPPTVTIDLEAVYVEVDTSGAGGPVTAELTISEQSGVVIARKRQAETVDAGAAGSATWALRLADDSAAGGGGPTVTQGDVAYGTVTVPPGGGATEVTVPWTGNLAGDVWDYTAIATPKAKHAGLLIVRYSIQANPAAPMAAGSFIQADLQTPAPIAVFPDVLVLIATAEPTAAIPAPRINATASKYVQAGDGVQLKIANTDVNPVDCFYFIRSDFIIP